MYDPLEKEIFTVNVVWLRVFLLPHRDIAHIAPGEESIKNQITCRPYVPMWCRLFLPGILLKRISIGFEKRGVVVLIPT